MLVCRQSGFEVERFLIEQEKILRHLIRDYDRPVRDPVWQHIGLSEPLLKLTAMPAFQKLSGIKQLGPAYLVYPGATHTRLNHSLGVFHVARRMMMRLLPGGSRRAAGVWAAAGGPPAFTLEGVKAFLCAALLHDLGHYPYAHSLKDLRVQPHEALTARLIMEEDCRRRIRDGVGADPQLVAAIIDHSLVYEGGEALEFFRHLLSGVLDPDKLDYLNRDAYFCGIPYGIQDVDFVLEEILPDQRYGLAITRQGLTAVESILFSKYLMYRTVYWHKTVRVATSMIKKAVALGLEAGAIRPEQLYFLSDAELFALTGSIDFPPFRLIGEVARRRLYKRVLRVSYRPEDPLHGRLEDLAERARVEAELAREAAGRLGRRVDPQEIVIDLPEPISFEIDVPILDPHTRSRVFFRESESVFSEEVVEGFRRSLRAVSLFCSRDEPLIAALREAGARRLGEGSA